MAHTFDRPQPARRGTPFAAIGGLLRRLPRNPGALAILACIVLVTSFSLAALPGFVARMSDDGLQRTVADARPFERNISLTQVSALPLGPTGSPNPLIRNVGDAEAVGATLQAAMPPLVQGAIDRRTAVIDTPRWIVRGLPGAPQVATQRFLQLRHQSDLDGRLRLVEGRLPAPRNPATLAALTGDAGAGNDELPVYEMAVSRATAEELEIVLGGRVLVTADPAYLRESGLRLPPANYRIVVEVVGLIEATAPTDQFWLDDPRLMQPGVFETPDFTLIYGTGLLAPEAFPDLLRRTSPEPWTYQWRYFTDPTRLNQDQLAEFESSIRRLGLIYPPTTRPSTGLADLARRFADQRTFAVSILALAAAGLAATALAVLGVLAALLAERHRVGLALVRSRGASTGQIAATQALEGLLVAGPVALLGGAAALAWLRPSTALPSLAAIAATALAATTTLVAATLPVAGQNLGAAARRQVEARRAAAPRLVLEGLVLILTAVGVVLLRRRGLAATGQLVDPYLVAVPILLALAAGIVALRLLPLLARALDRPAAFARGLVPLLATRRLARMGGAQLAILAVLLAVALATFATIVQGSIDRALDGGSWQRIGADYRIEVQVPAIADAPPALDLGGVAGVAATARADLYPNASIAPSIVRLGDVALLALDAPAYANVVAGTPADQNLPTALLSFPPGAEPGSRDNPLPVAISSRWVSAAVPRPGDRFGLDFGGVEVNFVVREVRDTFPGLAPERPFVIAPLDGLRAVERLPNAPTALLFARAPAGNTAPIEAAIRDQTADLASQIPPTVTSRRAEYDRARGLPLVAGVTAGFRWGRLLMALLALGAVVAAAEQLGRERAYERGYLRLLGLPGRGATTLALLELLPPLIVATLGGSLLGVAMIRILGPAINLNAFAAPGQSIALGADWPPIAALVVAVIGVATLAGLVLGRSGARATGTGELLREVNR